MQDFRKLSVYVKAIEYCKEIYSLSGRLPDSERFGLTSQIRRAASSIPLNISEGAGTFTPKEFSVFIGYAYRSVNEVLACLTLIKELKLLKDKESLIRLENYGLELSRMLYALFRKLNKI